jgi:DNA-binding response OmpR family regulator
MAMPDEATSLEAVQLAPLQATVLVIDDDPDMVESLAMLLEDHGFAVLTANNGVRGLEAFREHRPVAVLTDIMMPEQDGIETILQMRRERAEVKIVAISGAGRVGKTDFLAIARKLGADARFEKGRSANELLMLLRATLRR